MKLDEPIQLAEIETRLSFYASFYDHEAGRKLSDLVEGTTLDRPALVLCGTWKAASNTMRLPWLTVHSLESFADGFGKSRAVGPNFAAAVSHRLAGEMQTLNRIQRLELDARTHSIQSKVRNALDSEKATTAKDFWRVFLDPNNAEFRLALWGSQRIAYGAAYFAYENFIQEVLAVIKNEPEYRMDSVKTMKKDVLKHFGQTILDECVNDKQVTIARMVRNALSHNGGREDKELAKLPHGISVVEGVLQIKAGDNQRLMKLLQDRAYKFAIAALAAL